MPKQDTAHGNRTTPLATGDHNRAAFDCDYAQHTDGLAAWQEQSGLQIWFMLSSVITLMLNITSLVLNVLFGETLLGIVVASIVVWVFLVLGLVGLTLVVHKGCQHIDVHSKVKVATCGASLLESLSCCATVATVCLQVTGNNNGFLCRHSASWPMLPVCSLVPSLFCGW